MSTTTIRIQATEEQLQQFERQCELNELLLAQSLCRRYQIPTTQENLGIVAGWMASARSMGIVAHSTAGIQMTCDDQAKPLDLGDLRQMALDLCYLIEESGASPELTKISVRAAMLQRAINALMPEGLPVDRPTVVCLCGSTRYAEQFRIENIHETMAGRIVLSIGVDTKSDIDIASFVGKLTPEDKAKLDELHLRKIDLADEILVLNVDDYIGESTRREIAYARANGKRVRWWGPTQHSEPGEIAG